MAVTLDTERMKILNYMDDTFHKEIKRDIAKGLTATQKHIPCKYFYDFRGSNLFEEICLLPEYYLTRTELSILKDATPVIMKNFRQGDLIELGAGANRKVRILLDAAYKSYHTDIRYVPVDVSKSALLKASRELLKIYPDLKVLGIVADFTKHLEKIPTERNKLIIFFGSTIGNLNEEESNIFLRNIASLMESGDRFLLGIDMIKSKKILELAYNDTKGVTSEFNKNILNVLNRRLGANFNSEHFKHLAFLNTEKEQIEMHLQANCDVSVKIKELDLSVEIEEGETIQTEVCRKFSRESAGKMANEGGLKITRWFSDNKGWFSIIELATK